MYCYRPRCKLSKRKEDLQGFPTSTQEWYFTACLYVKECYLMSGAATARALTKTSHNFTWDFVKTITLAKRDECKEVVFTSHWREDAVARECTYSIVAAPSSHSHFLTDPPCCSKQIILTFSQTLPVVGKRVLTTYVRYPNNLYQETPHVRTKLWTQFRLELAGHITHILVK